MVRLVISVIVLMFGVFFYGCQGASKCHNGMCYQVIVYPNSTWFDARKTCRRLGGHLASVEDWKTEWTLEGLLQQTHQDLAPWLHSYSAWLGGTQNMSTSWYWASQHWDSHGLGWSRWAPSQSRWTTRQACVAMQADLQYQWTSRECTDYLWFVCLRHVDEHECQAPNEFFTEGVCYHLNTSSQTWYEARRQCHLDLQGDLATVHNNAVHSNIIRMAKRLGQDGLEDFWIGATRTNWTWSAHGDPIMFSNWGFRYDPRSEEMYPFPSSAPTGCLQLHFTDHCYGETTSDPCFFWKDVNCSGRAVGLVCQFPEGSSNDSGWGSSSGSGSGSGSSSGSGSGSDSSSGSGSGSDSSFGSGSGSDSSSGSGSGSGSSSGSGSARTTTIPVTLITPRTIAATIQTRPIKITTVISASITTSFPATTSSSSASITTVRSESTTSSAGTGNADNMSNPSSRQALPTGAVVGGVTAVVVVVTILVIVIVVIKRRKHAQSESKERGAFNNPSYTENIRAVSVRDDIYSEPNDDYMPREGGDHPHQTTCSEMNAEHYYQKLQYSNQSQEENIYAQIGADEDIAESYIDFSAYDMPVGHPQDCENSVFN